MRMRRIKISNIILLGILVFSSVFFVFEKPARAANEDIIITEIMYDLSGSDDGREWIELYNKGAEEVTIIGGSYSNSWKFYDGSGNRLLASTPYQGSMMISPGSYALLVQDPLKFKEDYPNFPGSITIIQVSNMSLNNTDATIGLRIGSSGPLWSQVTYNKSQGANGNGKTLERKNLDETFLESLVEKGTPGAENSTPSPTPSLTPSATPSPTPTPSPTSSPSPTSQLTIPKLVQVGEILITELMPNPPTGENEWIEIYNRTNREIDLTGLTIEDNTGPTYGTGKGKALDGLTIPAYSYLTLIKGQNFSFSLNNSGDIVILKRDTLIIDQVTYGDFEDDNPNNNAPKPEQGIALARSGDLIDTDWDAANFYLTTKPTPGAANLISAPKLSLETEESKTEESETEESEQIADIVQTPPPTSKEPTPTPSPSKNQQTPLVTNLTNLRSLEKGTTVKVQGVVAVEPGILGKTIFYLNGLQVYCYRQNFPVLQPGDLVEINGTLSEINSETRIKFKDKNDVKILGKETIAPQPASAEEINEELEGRLVLVKGQIIEKTGSRIYLDDGTGEAVIYFKTSAGLSKKEIKEGDFLAVTGIVSRNGDSWQILPRYQSDLKITNSKDEQDLSAENPQSKEIDLTTTGNNANEEVNLSQKELSSIGNLLISHPATTAQYLIMTATALFAFLFALIIKMFL